MTLAALDAQSAGRELSRLEACVIAQYILDPHDSLWHDIYYRPRSCAGLVSAGIAQNYRDAPWAERAAFDMLGTYCLNTPDL